MYSVLALRLGVTAELLRASHGGGQRRSSPALTPVAEAKLPCASHGGGSKWSSPALAPEARLSSAVLAVVAS